MSRKQVIVAGIAGALVAVALAGYFVVLPNKQASSYKTNVKSKHAELHQDVAEVGKILDSESFVKTDVEVAQMEADVRKGREAIKEAEATLARFEKDLTGYSAMPLTDWSDSSKSAKELKAQEEQYITELRAYMQELSAVVDFLDQSIEMQKAITKFMADAELVAQKEQTYPEIAAQLETPVKNLEKAINKFATLKAPASIKEMVDFSNTSSQEFLSIVKQEVAALKADDAEKFESLVIKEQEKMNENAVKFEELNSKFVKESNLRKMADKVNELNRKITDQLAKS
jgi:hypothetical protein